MSSKLLSVTKYFVLMMLYPPLLQADQQVNLHALSLEQAIQIAGAFNHDLRLSEYLIVNANAASQIAAVAPNPVLTVQTFNINAVNGIGSGSLLKKTVDSTIRIDQLIERGGKRELRTESAAYMENAAKEDFQDMRRQIRINVSQAYYDLLAAEEKRAITRQTALLYESTMIAAQKRQKAGDIAASDVARLQVEAMSAKNDETQSEFELTKARQALALVMGKAAQAQEIRLTDGWPELKFDIAVPSDSLVEQRFDVLGAKSRLNAALSARKLANSLRVRDVTVGVQYEHFPATDANPQGSGNSYGLAIQIPIFARNTFDGEVLAAESAITMAQENLEKTRDLARNYLQISWQDAQASYLRMKQFDEGLLAAAKKSADAAEFAFKHGAIGVIDVLDTRRTLRSVELNALAAHVSFAKSVSVMQATMAVSENKI